MRRKTKATKPKTETTLSEAVSALRLAVDQIGLLHARVGDVEREVSGAAIDAKVQAATQRVVTRADAILNEVRTMQKAAQGEPDVKDAPRTTVKPVVQRQPMISGNPLDMLFDSLRLLRIARVQEETATDRIVTNSNLAKGIKLLEVAAQALAERASQ